MSKFRFLTGAAFAASLFLSGCAGVQVSGLPHTAPIASVDVANPPALIELNFQSEGKRLNGHIYLANGAGPHPTFILLHGFPGNERNLDLAQSLRADGFNVLFFHYRGAWGSEGAYSLTNIIEDVASAKTMLLTRAEDYRVAPSKISLIGHSMGGFAALQGAARDTSIECVAGIAAADIGARAEVLETNPEASNGFATYTDTMQMLAGLTGEALIAEIMANRDAFTVRNLGPRLTGKSVLLVAADKDTAVPPETTHVPMVEAYADVLKLELTHTVLSGDHSFSWSRSALTETVLDWAQACK